MNIMRRKFTVVKRGCFFYFTTLFAAKLAEARLGGILIYKLRSLEA